MNDKSNENKMTDKKDRERKEEEEKRQEKEKRQNKEERKEKEKRQKEEMLRFGSLVAHQLKSPVGAAGSILKVLLEEYAGQLNPKQKDLAQRADKRLTEALESIKRMLTIVSPKEKEAGEDVFSDMSRIARIAYSDYMDEAKKNNTSFDLDIREEPAFVAINEAGATEVLNSILHNAFKYTPQNGKIRISILPQKEEEILVSIEDSGAGIPENLRERIFDPFFRTSSAKKTSVPGTGLGLSLVKSIVDAGGGKIWVDRSELGGAAFKIVLPKRAGSSPNSGQENKEEDDPRTKVVIIGGVAAGPKVAARVMRLLPDTAVTIIEKGSILSYAGCGFPYYVSGVVKEQKQLLSTPLGMVRDPVFFQNLKNVRVLNKTEAVKIDRNEKRVRIRDLESNRERWINYDKLVLATGSVPKIPSLPGSNLKNIYTLHGVKDAEGIRAHVSAMQAKDVVLIGGGLISVEITEALVRRGCRVTIIEKLDQILSSFDWEMAKLITNHMEAKGVRVLTNSQPKSFVGKDVVEGVVTEKGPLLPADLVIIGTGVRPQVDLAENAGLEIGSTSAIKVNEHLCTSDPHIYGAGDCIETSHLITGKPCYIPLGSTANKQGRVVADNICGRESTFPGVIGSTVCKVFDYCVARTGLTESWAINAGYDVVTSLNSSPDREPFMPKTKNIMIKVIADKESGKLLGVQAIGTGNGDKRVDVAAAAITAGMTVEDVANLDLCYAPPYSLAMDNLITAVNIVRNKHAGLFEGITAMEVYEKIKRKDDFILLDVSTPQEYENTRLPGSTLIPSGSLRGRLEELPRDKEIVVFCSTSLRGYETSLILRAHGFKKVRVMDGGISMWPYEKIQ